MSLGLALSGGGSRAAGFHAGVVAELSALKAAGSEKSLLDSVKVVSAVSGGSLFAAAWMAARHRQVELPDFLSSLQKELANGFILRSIRPRLFKALLPGVTRADVLAETFNKVFFQGMTLGQLPDEPRLCINASLLNNGQLGKFSKGTFQCAGLVAPDEQSKYSMPIPMEKFPLSRAATASAAFPGLLPPLYLPRGEGGIPTGWGKTAELREAKRFALVDGGVLDNLGVQSLLSTMSGFAAWDLVVSDAGTREEGWKPKGLFGKSWRTIVGTVGTPFMVGTGFLSTDDLLRVSLVMHSKEVRQMRQQLFAEQAKSWLAEAAVTGTVSAAMKSYLEDEMRGIPDPRRRKVLFARVNQTWGELVTKIPLWRRMELAQRAGLLPGQAPPQNADLATVEAFLIQVGVPVASAKCLYNSMGGDAAVARLNDIATGFCAIPRNDLGALATHGRWQVQMLHAVYW